MNRHILSIGGSYIALFEFFLWFPGKFILLLLFGLFVLGYTLWYVSVYVSSSNLRLRSVICLIWFAQIFCFMYASLIEVVWLRHSAIVGMACVFVASLSLLRREHIDSSTRLRFHYVATTIFLFCALVFLSATAHGLKVFVISRTITLPSGTALLSALIADVWFSAWYIPRRARLLSTISTFIIAFEGFWVVEFLPFGALSLALLQTIPVMVLVLFEKYRMIDKSPRSMYIQTALSGIVVMLLVIVFSRWS